MSRPLPPRAEAPGLVALLALFVGSLAASHGVDLLLGHPPLLGDAQWYHERADNLWHGRETDHAHYWPPGLPLLLLALYRVAGVSDPALGQAVMSVLVAATAVLLARLGWELFGSRRVALGAGGLFALHPTVLFFARQTETHVLCALLIVALGWVSLRWARGGGLGWAAAAGAVMGALVLTRPGSAPLALLVAAVPLLAAWARPRAGAAASWPPALLQGAVSLLLVAAVLAPVLRFNHAHGAGWVLSTNNERNFFIGNNPFTHPYKTGQQAWRPLEALPPEVQTYLRSLYDAPQPRQRMVEEATRYILEQPGAFAQRSFNRFKNFWAFDYEAGRRLQLQLAEAGRWSWLPMALQALVSVIVVALLFAGLPALWRSPARGPVAVMLAACLVYQAPHVVAFASPVYRAGLLPLICLLAVAGLAAWRSAPAGRRPGGWGWPVAVVLALAYVNLEAAYYLNQLR